MNDLNEIMAAGQAGNVSKAEFDKWFDERFEYNMKKMAENKTPSMSLIATKGTLDWAYPPFILASTAAALGWKVSIFFTFYGLLLLKKDLSDMKVTPVGNPAMPMKMPFGPDWFKNINWPVPNAVAGNIPGFENMASGLMKETFKSKGVASIEELREISIDEGVELHACQMTVDVFGFTQDDFIDDISSWCGATSFLPTAGKSDVTLFI